MTKTLTKNPKPLNGISVLIVEDEMMQAWKIGDMVAELGGYVPTIAFRMEEAVEALRKNSFDCAILDINLNGTLSFPIAEELQKRCIPVLFCTAYDEASTLFQGPKPVPRLDKPVDKRDVRDAILGLLRDVGHRRLAEDGSDR